MSALEKIVDDLVGAIEADIDSGEESQELDRSVVAQLRDPSAAPNMAVDSKREAPVRTESFAGITEEITACKKCSLHKTRTNVVPGQGKMSPDIMFIGEAPGADEDAQGLSFVGRAGKLLTKMIVAMGYTRDDVFIGNILKCRPPDNRTPVPEEIAMCIPYLLRQIAVLRPKVIVALGGTAVRGLLKDETPISKLRGKWTEFAGVPLMPTYHPAYLLRSPSAKRDSWADLQAVLKKLGKKAPPVKKD
jgi:uracil-DNA glycosylase family 4